MATTTSESTMRRIRVLLIAPSMRIVGGQSVQANRLRHYIGTRPEVNLSFLCFDAPLPAAIGRIPLVRTIVRYLIYWGVLVARAWKYDVLHVFTASYWSYTLWSIPALLTAKIYRKKIILNYRDGRAEDHLRHWRSAALTIRWMDVIVAPSGYLCDVFAQFGMRCRSICNVIDRENFIYRRRSVLRPEFLHNRGMEALYNIPTTLGAFAIVQQKYPNATLTILGDGPMRVELEQLATNLKLRNTRFVGSIPNSKMPQWLDKADIYLTTPDIDCMPGSLLECYASGLPVVATKAGGIPYIAVDGETALLAECGDHKGVAEAALQLLCDPALVEKITSTAYEHCRTRYAGEEIALQWVGLYKELVSTAAGAARR
jgi:glycosyltransferase involved in cell wall biosynthesis